MGGQAGRWERGEHGMQPVGLIPRLHGPDSSFMVSLVLHPQFCRLRSEEHIGEASTSPDARAQMCPWAA